MKKIAFVFTLAFLLCATQSYASQIVYDHFDDGSLSSDWIVKPGWHYSSKDTGLGLNYTEQGSHLNVDGIIHRESVITAYSTRGRVDLIQTFDPLEDFRAQIDFSWDSWDDPGLSWGFLQVFSVGFFNTSLHSSSGLGTIGLSQIANSHVDPEVDVNYMYTTGRGSGSTDKRPVGTSGSGSLVVIRENGNMQFFWNGNKYYSFMQDTPIDEFRLRFQESTPSGPEGESVVPGTVSIDLVKIEDSIDVQATPEPAAIILALSALIAGLLFWKKFAA